MKKDEFIKKLRKRLSGLPKKEAEERISFYSEMIDDRIEEGLPEEDAVLAVGSVEEIAKQIRADIPHPSSDKNEKTNPKRRLKAWEIVLLALGSPIWLSLAIAAASVIFSIYISLCAVIISLWTVPLSLAVSFLAGIVAGIVLAFSGKALSGLAVIGAGMICGGLAIFMFFGCMGITKCVFILTKKTFIWIKKCFTKKEAE